MLNTKCSFVFLVRPCLKQLLGFPGDASSKEPGYKESIRDPGSIPGSGRSPGGGHGNPLQYSCPEKPMDSGAWQATVCGSMKMSKYFSISKLDFFLIMLYEI